MDGSIMDKSMMESHLFAANMSLPYGKQLEFLKTLPLLLLNKLQEIFMK
jgi:hypothetical protein